MQPDYAALAVRCGEILNLAQGMTLKVARLTRQGLEFVFESATARTEVHVLPKVYTEGKVIVDPINDLTIVLEVKQYALDQDGQAALRLSGHGKIELPYSTWFFEGDYL